MICYRMSLFSYTLLFLWGYGKGGEDGKGGRRERMDGRSGEEWMDM